MAPHSASPLRGHSPPSEESCQPSHQEPYESFNLISNGPRMPSSSGHRLLDPASSETVPSPYLPPTSAGSDGSASAELDLICVGFGPASLAIAIALHDALAAGQGALRDGSVPRVLFLEKQAHFSWHAGMLLPGAKMQISFIKDLATLRNPRSEFTFLNYLHRSGRLVDFTNLGTFLPDRVEFEDYLRWSASHFHRQVEYGREVLSISPAVGTGSSPVRTFVVRSRDAKTGQIHIHSCRRVLLATGGRPSFPHEFPDPDGHPSMIHSSQFAHLVPEILPNNQAAYRIAVVGAGQSAAEIFHNAQKLYPNSKTFLIMRQEFLRPSDDSPFVNSVFNPEYIDTHFPRSAHRRQVFLREAKATNYGVVRLELIEALYETMYHQKRDLGRDERTWPHRILGRSQITSIVPHSNTSLEVKIQCLTDRDEDRMDHSMRETLEVDLLIAATGYQRDAHLEMLRDTWDMLPEASPSKRDFYDGTSGWNVKTNQTERHLAVGRDYQVKFAPGRIAKGSGIWLQGCCEGTHGVGFNPRPSTTSMSL